VVPEAPEAFNALGMKEESCKVRLFINEEGDVTDVKPEACPEVLIPAAKEAAYKTKFFPLKDENGKAFKAQFVIRYKFVAK
jgi:hypothetical protein